MSERKVLNKYYPPDFDPTKIPRARVGRNKQFTVRLMAPCNMCCNTCGEYIYKGKKFNARKEDVENEDYLGIRIYRFYIKCTRCISEICFKTDPESTDYIIEAGATRNFMALKLAEEQAVREEKAEKEDDETNPMKVLEKRTLASRHEMEVLEALEELKELNQRQITPDYETMLRKYERVKETQANFQEAQDEEFVQSIFGKKGEGLIKRIEESSSGSSDDDDSPPKKKILTHDKGGVKTQATDFLVSSTSSIPNTPSQGPSKSVKEISIGTLGLSKKPFPLVKKPLPAPETKKPAVTALSLISAYSDDEETSD